jgi:eukaryotic-like serine/threonine-protein kinase
MSAWMVPGYTEERELGRGASGRVVAAVHDDSGQEVAIKYLAPRLFRDPAFLSGFREEAEVLRQVRVPQVVRLYDYVEDPGQGAAIVMELVNGVSLHQMITREGSTSPESALVVLKGSLLGLASAHRAGIVHRDYKPENVLVTEAGNSKLTDFGVAVRAGKKAPAAGTPLYMAPEQWAGAAATPATDIYAATAVFFECLTGKTPFSGRLGQLAAQHETAAVPVTMVDEPLQALIARGMAKDPRERPANALEFVGELDWVAERAYGPDWEERGRGDLARRASALLLLLLGGVAGAAGGSFGATLLSALARRKRLAIIGASVGVIAAIAVTSTTLALSGNNTAASTNVASGGPSASGGGSSSAGGSSTTPGTGSSAPGSPTPTTAAPTTTSPAATTPAATTPAGGGNPVTTTNPPTTTPPVTATSSPAPAKPVITLAVSASPASPVNVTCGRQKSVTFTVTGTIHSTQATTVHYSWSASGKSASVGVGKGGSVSVTDSVTLPVSTKPSSGSDALTVSSPSSVSASVPFSASCSFPALQVTNPGAQTGNEGQPFSVDIPVSGGNGSYNFSVSGASWVSVSSSGTVSGTPPRTDTNCSSTTYTLTVTVSDTESPAQTQPVTFTVQVFGLCIK